MPTWKTAKLKNLARAFCNIKDEKQMLAFLRDLATLEELSSLSSRWQAVQMINKKIPYRKISEKTGLSTATITRIAHWLNHGEGGYKIALSKVKK